MSSQHAHGSRTFDVRLGLIAKSIVSRKIGVVGLQEPSPGSKGKRPTTKFERALRKAGASRDKLRTRQVKHVVQELEKRNTAKLPIVLVGDLNTWRGRSSGKNPHDYLAKRGFVDSFVAKKRTNAQFSTYNDWRTRMSGTARLDYVLVKSGAGVLRYRNVMKKVDKKRPSDHNLVIGDVRLPAPR